MLTRSYGHRKIHIDPKRNMSIVAGSTQAVLLTAEAIEKSEEVFGSCVAECASDDGRQVVDEAAQAAVADFDIKVVLPVTLFGSPRFGLLQH